METKIKDAYFEITPNVLDRVLSSAVEKEERIEPMSSVQTNKKTKWIAGIGAACAAILLIFGSVFYLQNRIADSTILLDVNPSIELTVNRSDRVLEANALNEDGKKVLNDMELKNTDIDVAVNAVIGSMVKHGYLDADKNSILVSVDNKDQTKAERLKKEIVQDISVTLKGQNIKGTIYNQTLDSSQEDAKALTQKYDISLGKAVFLAKLTEAYPELNYDELAKMSLENIAELVKDRNLALNTIIDCDEDDSVKENIEDAIEDVNERCRKCTGKYDCDDCDEYKNGCPECDESCACSSKNTKSETVASAPSVINSSQSVSSQNASSQNASSQSASDRYIDAEKAKEIALKHAGLSADQVTFEKVELEHDDGRAEYEIEFYTDHTEYDYEIDASNGNILSAEAEKDTD